MNLSLTRKPRKQIKDSSGTNPRIKKKPQLKSQDFIQKL